MNCTRGCKGMFEYDVIKYCNAEKTQHVGSCKVDKEYTIYVDKKNNNSFVSIKVLANLMFFSFLESYYFFVLHMDYTWMVKVFLPPFL